MKLFALSTRRGSFPRLIGEPNNSQCAEGDHLAPLTPKYLKRLIPPSVGTERKIQKKGPASFTSPLVHIHLTSLFWMHAGSPVLIITKLKLTLRFYLTHASHLELVGRTFFNIMYPELHEMKRKPSSNGCRAICSVKITSTSFVQLHLRSLKCHMGTSAHRCNSVACFLLMLEM